MLPGGRLLRALCSIALLIFCAAVLHGQVRTASPEAPIAADGLGKGTIPLDGLWQFHVGDDMAWANRAFDDSHWEQLSADKPWGAQGHFAYTGFVWYRRTLDITPAPGASPEIALLVPEIDDAYEVYWNGQLVGRHGHVPP